METATLGVDLINSVASLAETILQLLKKVSEWNLLQKDIPEAIDNFRTDLNYVNNCLTPMKNHIHELDKHFSERLNFEKLSIDADYCSDKLKELETHLNNIHFRSQTKCMRFPSTRVNRLEYLREQQTTLISNVESLIKSIDSLKMEYDELQKPYINMAPLPESNLILNFEDQSPEREILDETLEKESSPIAIGAVSRGPAPTRLGPGGVGKSQTICLIAHRHEIRVRFPGGIFSSNLVQRQARKTLYPESHI